MCQLVCKIENRACVWGTLPGIEFGSRSFPLAQKPEPWLRSSSDHLPANLQPGSFPGLEPSPQQQSSTTGSSHDVHHDPRMTPMESSMDFCPVDGDWTRQSEPPIDVCPIGDWATGPPTRRRHPGPRRPSRHTKSHRPIWRTARAACHAKVSDQASRRVSHTDAHDLSAPTALSGPTLSSSSSSSFSPAALLRCRLEGRDQAQIVDGLWRDDVA